MNKKLQSMYANGGLLKALLNDPAQAKMARKYLGMAAEGMAVNKSKLGMPGTAVPGAKNTYAGGGVAKKYRAGGTMYANGGQNGPGGLLARLFGKKEEAPARQTAKQAWQEAGYDREPVNWDRTTQSTRDANLPAYYQDYTPMNPNAAKPAGGNEGVNGMMYGIGSNSPNYTPAIPEQIARDVRASNLTYTDATGQQHRGGLANTGTTDVYTGIVPSMQQILQAINQSNKFDLSDAMGGGANAMTAEEYLRTGMGEYGGPDFHTPDMVKGREMFDYILKDAMEIAQEQYERELNSTRNKKGGFGGRDVRGGETKEEARDRQLRSQYAPEIAEYNLRNRYGDRIIESMLGPNFDQAQADAMINTDENIRNAVIDMLNNELGTDIFNQYRGYAAQGSAGR